MERNKPIHSLIDFVNTFSIWVVLGSLVTYWFFALSFNQEPNGVVGLILALSIWVIYTFDHLLDGIQTKGESLSKRHYLHYKYKKSLVVLLIVFSVIILYLVYFQLDYKYVPFGILLFVLTAIHFAINHLVLEQIKVRFYIKEVFIALVVSLGFCGLPLVPMIPNDVPSSTMFLFVPFFLLNLSNLMLFSYFDFEEDLENKFISSANIFGPSNALSLAKIGSIISIVLTTAIVLLFTKSYVTSGTLIIMNGFLLIISFNPTYFKTNGYYRFWGDFIYLFPALALPFL